VPAESDGALVLLGDMPRIDAAHIDAMIASFTLEARVAIVVPVHEGQRGNPVLWPADLFAEMLALEGDAGARSLMARHPDRVREIDLGTDAVLTDVDTPEALARLRSGAA
jgi:molybdenum cofactor cytidylyltransferase